MNDLANHITDQLGIIILAAVIAQFFAYKFRIHAIVLLVFLGILIGPVFQVVNPEALFGNLFHIIIEFSVVIILFEGGLNLKFHEFKDVESGLTRLISLGVFINAVLGSVAAHYIGGFSWSISLLLGSILVVTGPTVIIPVLRQVKLPKEINSYLRWEGIMNDPIGILITIILFQYLISQDIGSNPINVLFEVFKALVISIVLAFITGSIITNFIKRFGVPDFMKVPLVLSSAILLYIFSGNVHEGSGLLAITLYSIYLGNQDIAIMNELKRFKESMSVILVSFVFVVLASSIKFETLSHLTLSNYAFIALIVFLIRPISIMLATVGSDMTLQERFLVGWFGPRGVVAVSMAGIIGIEMLNHGFSEAEQILPVIFLIVVGTIIIHSSTLELVAKKLGLSLQSGEGLLIVGASLWSTNLSKLLQKNKIPVMIVDSNSSRLMRPKREGIAVFDAEILENLESGDLDFSKYGYLLASTENDAYNALVCQKASNDLSPKNVSQIPLSTDLTYDNLQQQSYYGWGFEEEKITKEADYEELTNKYKDTGTYNLLVIRSDKSLTFVSPSIDPLQKGDILINFLKRVH